MTKQEEIKEGIANEIHSKMFDLGHVHNWDDAHDYAKAIVKYLHSQGVVIKVDRELPKSFTASWVDWEEDDILKVAEWDTRKALKKAGYVAIVPLIKEIE